jgi:uncharacterized membrane protein YgcG
MSQPFGLEAAMIECQRLWEQTQDLAACIERFPQYEGDIRQHFKFATALAEVHMPPAREFRRQQGWQELSGQFFQQPNRPMPLLRFAAPFAAVVLGVFAVSAVGAASKTFDPPGPVSRIFDRIETLPNFIGVTEEPLPMPVTSRPTATPMPRQTATPTKDVPAVAPSPIVAPVIEPSLRVTSTPTPPLQQLLPSPERGSPPVQRETPTTMPPVTPTPLPPTPTRTPTQAPTSTQTSNSPQVSGSPGNPNNAPSQSATMNPGTSGAAARSGNSNANGAGQGSGSQSSGGSGSGGGSGNGNAGGAGQIGGTGAGQNNAGSNVRSNANGTTRSPRR